MKALELPATVQARWRPVRELYRDTHRLRVEAEEADGTRVWVAVVASAMERDYMDQVAAEAARIAVVKPRRIAPLLAWGLESEGYWIVTGARPGRSLATLLEREGALDVPRLLRLARHLLQAVAHCHARDVLPRDICPSTVWIQPDGRAVLTHLLESFVEWTWTEDHYGGIAGDPGTLAPGLFSPMNQHSARTNLYALGATLYAAATGRPLFACHEEHVYSHPELLTRLVSDFPPRLAEVLHQTVAHGEAWPSSAKEFQWALHWATGTVPAQLAHTVPGFRWPEQPGHYLISSTGAHALSDRPQFVGSDPHAGISVTGADVEPLHAAVVLGPHGPLLYDLGRTTPALVNRQPAAKSTLACGDIVQLGAAPLVYMHRPPVPPDAPYHPPPRFPVRAAGPSAPDPMDAALALAGTERRIPFKAEPLRFGADDGPGGAPPRALAGVSRAGFWVSDCRCPGDLTVNNRAVRFARLEHGDVIALGDERLVFQRLRPAEPAVPDATDEHDPDAIIPVCALLDTLPAALDCLVEITGATSALVEITGGATTCRARGVDAMPHINLGVRRCMELHRAPMLVTAPRDARYTDPPRHGIKMCFDLFLGSLVVIPLERDGTLHGLLQVTYQEARPSAAAQLAIEQVGHALARRLS